MQVQKKLLKRLALIGPEYPCGSTPSFGFLATFIVDEKVKEIPSIYTGGGSENSLIKVTHQELVRLSGALLAQVRR